MTQHVNKQVSNTLYKFCPLTLLFLWLTFGLDGGQLCLRPEAYQPWRTVTSDLRMLTIIILV